ncbi:hypothetical protein LQ953_01645 [Sphingomonas sp. IC-56]|uniref:hypothetical protein n=1 Tax=Sphingomonas sp. IC-56 TaxID=2898529 RepID=UPI001E3F8A6C|nr:hypothetical protein [Sphingomonas sp. IC-56]MCD2322717.1 hypothetical protein [Sphingomonas sp. IC-56]
MKRLLIASTLPVFALPAACGGGGGNEIITTNDNNVVLNDAHSNFAFSNEGETPANDAGAMSADTANGSMSNDMSSGGTTTNAM